MIQDKVNKEWNNPDYNNWLKFNKHRTFIDGEKALEKIADLYGAEQAFKNLDYKETCKKLYEVFGKHKEWAELVIKIALDGYKTIDVAKEKGVTREVISHKYRRAINFLKNVYKKRPVLTPPKVYI